MYLWVFIIIIRQTDVNCSKQNYIKRRQNVTMSPDYPVQTRRDIARTVSGSPFFMAS